ncbi:MAG: hypothetical protein M1831_004217 [Alyxoria varia]|nr:MAG: hypothetical protein M1831_004217 [Alyxoria varia]
MKTDKSIDHLPNEILHDIVERLQDEWEKGEDEEAFEAMANLSKTSKRLHQISTPLLYRTFIFGDYELRPDTHPLWLFTRTILSNEKIASLVTTFSCVMFSARDKRVNPQDEGPPGSHVASSEQYGSEDERIFASRVRACSPHKEPEAWFHGVWTIRGVDAITALLLSHLPDLKRLQLKCMIGLEYEAPFTGQLIKQVALRTAGPHHSPQALLRRVEDVMITGNDDKDPTHPEGLATCLRLPSVRRLRGLHLGIYMEGDYDEEFSGYDLPPSCAPHVEEIELRNSKLNMYDLPAILRACKSLKTFIYVVGACWAWTPVRTALIQELLEEQRDALENLELDMTELQFEYENENAEDRQVYLRPMSLSRLRRLKRLRIGAIFLWGTDEWRNMEEDDEKNMRQAREKLVQSIPPSIELVHLTNCGAAWPERGIERINYALEALLQCQHERFPRLREVIIQGKDLASKIPFLSEMLGVAAERGIQVTLLNDLYDSSAPPWGFDRDDCWPRLQDTNNRLPAYEIL